MSTATVFRAQGQPWKLDVGSPDFVYTLRGSDAVAALNEGDKALATLGYRRVGEWVQTAAMRCEKWSASIEEATS